MEMPSKKDEPLKGEYSAHGVPPSSASSSSSTAAPSTPDPATASSNSGRPNGHRPQIIYALVARGPDCVLVEHAGLDSTSGQESFSGNFKTFTSQLLQRMDPSVEWKSYVYEEHAFHYIIDPRVGLWYLCMAEASMGRRIPFGFLAELQESFERLGYTQEQVDEGRSRSMQSEFAREAQALMDKYNSPKADRVACMVDKVKSINETLMENIDRILERQEKIELLVQKSEAMSTDSYTFRTAARQVRTRVWWRTTRFYLALCGATVLVVFVIVLSQCGITFQECNN